MDIKEIILSIEKEIGFKLIASKKLSEDIYEYNQEFNISRNFEGRTPPMAFYGIEDGKITGIILNSCNLKNIPNSIIKIPTIKYLSLSHNQIQTIGEKVACFPFLEILDISCNKIVEIPDSLYKLKKLQFLNLGNNKIRSISKNIIFLNNLNTLLLNRNELTSVPKEIINLENLWNYTQKLVEFANQKNEIVRAQKYEEAASIRDAELKLIRSGKLGINLKGNEIENLPPELLYKGRGKIIDYWNSLDDNESLPVNEFKLIFVGEGGSGKTSLLKRITIGEFDVNEKQTHGININTWQIKYKGKTITANLWDFGGQEIMHSTHQFFLSNRSFYIVVIDSRREDKIEYWLKHIEALGANSPTLIVINKIDENPGFDVNRKFLNEKYTNIVGITRISCSTGEGISLLIETINDALSKINHINTLWPKSWFKLKQKIENINKDFITLNDFENYCKEEDIYSKQRQNTLLDFLHDLGVMLHFNDFGLKETNILNPKWVTDGVYKIINSRILAERFGILSIDLLEIILPRNQYPGNQLNFLISLMEKFELCYKINLKEILIPDLLSIQEPDFDLEPSLEFIFEYNFLPKSIFPRFIVRMKNDVKESLAWRTGVILENRNLKCLAKIVIDYEEKKINLNINGPNSRDYFSILHYTFTDINKSFSNLSISERIPLGMDNLTVGYQHLKNLEEMGIFQYLPEGATLPINVSETLGSITKSRKETIEEEILKCLNEIKGEIRDRGSLFKEANKILELKPNIAGIGININAIIERFLK